MPDAAKGVIVNQISGFELFADGRVASVPLEQPDLVIERSTLIRQLAQQASDAGAQLRLGRRFTGARPGQSGVHVELKDAGGAIEQAEVSALIGADGGSSRVARSAGWPARSTISLVQAIVPLPPDMRPDVTRIWFRPGDTRYFYWLIPESEDRGALGLIGDDPCEVRRALDLFLAEKRLEPIEYQAARIPSYAGWMPVRKRIGRGHAYLVGDAAGHVKVSTVGGIVTGFRGALGVAEAILTNGSSRELRRLRTELEAHRVLRTLLHRFAQDDYVRLLDSIDDSTRRALGGVTRDEAVKVLWQVLRRRPQIALVALRALMPRG